MARLVNFKLTEFNIFASFSGKNRAGREQPERFFYNHLQVFEPKNVLRRDFAVAVAQHAVNLVVNFVLSTKKNNTTKLDTREKTTMRNEVSR